MKVYVVFSCEDYEASSMEKIFFDECKAEAYCEDRGKEMETNYMAHWVYECCGKTKTEDDYSRFHYAYRKNFLIIPTEVTE